MNSPFKVTQADRDAAAGLIDAYFSGDSAMTALAQSYRGGYSHGAFPQAFARHRHEAQLPLLEMLEEHQRIFAMLIDPDTIKATSSVHAFAQITEAEFKVRTHLAQHKESPDA